jgi:hypothetical protein
MTSSLRRLGFIRVWVLVGLGAAAPIGLCGCDDTSCDDGGRSYEDGERWQCSDGCNSCVCSEGDVTSTRIGCGDAGS